MLTRLLRLDAAAAAAAMALVRAVTAPPGLEPVVEAMKVLAPTLIQAQ
jgi:hypothetical protein